MEFRTASEADDTIVARHYLWIWESYGTPPEHFYQDAEARVVAFLREGRESWKSGVFLAIEDGRSVGSAACQIQIAPYAEVIKPAHRRFGYIWSVYVDPAFRQRGIARQLVERCVAHLRSIGCTKAVLHSSDAGEQLYTSLGFERAKEMRLPL